MRNEIEQIAQQNDMSIEFVTWFFNEKKSACGEHWFLMLGAMWEGWKGRSIEIDMLAAENMGLKDLARGWANATDDRLFEEFGEICHDSIDDCEAELKTICPATDRIVAGIKADGRAEGINFAASRLAAAFNHGFVDKPMAEVFDVVRMILTAKEDLANDPVLAADGLSGEYAEKSLAEWEVELREGAK